MDVQSFSPEMFRAVQEEAARKLMNHLNYNEDFTESIIQKLFDNELTLARPIADVSINETEKNVKAKKPKRQYTITPSVKAQREFNASHKDAVLAQIKSENVDPKKVAGTLSKRLAALWKESSEKKALMNANE